MTKTLIILSLCVASLGLQAQEADGILGAWLTEEKSAKVEVYKESNRYFGKIVWLDDPTVDGEPRTDENNDDESLQNRPLLGLRILNDFVFDDGEWDDGTIYDPENGQTYDCVITKEGDALNVRGYVGFSFIGRSTQWTKAN